MNAANANTPIPAHLNAAQRPAAKYQAVTAGAANASLPVSPQCSRFSPESATAAKGSSQARLRFGLASGLLGVHPQRPYLVYIAKR